MKKEVKEEALKAIYKKHGILKPSDVVEEAADEDHPLHQYFQWDDTKAAHEYRLWQARELIVSVRIEWDEKVTDLYWNGIIEKDGKSEQGYFAIQRMLSDEDLYFQVLEDAIKELKYFQEKYSGLKDLKGIIDKRRLASLEKKFLDGTA